MNNNQHLLLAAKRGDIDSIKRAIDAGADVNAVTDSGYSPLILAVERGSPDCVELLIERGSNINYVADTPLVGQTTALKHSCYLGDYDIVKRLAECGGDIHYSDENNANLLFWACASRSDKRKIIVDYLLDRGVDINHQNNLGTTALMVVNYPGPFDAELFASMLARGADPTVENIMGHTVEFLASKLGRQCVLV